MNKVVDGIREFWPAIGLSLFLAVVSVASTVVGSSALQHMITEMMINLVVVIGLYVFIGNSGILSFGHISFMAIGAYAHAWFSCCTVSMVKQLYMPGLPLILRDNAYPFWVGAGAAGLLSGAVALVIGAVLMRLSGIAASIATFAVLLMTYTLYANWDSVTAGAGSLSNVPVDAGIGLTTVFAVASVLVAYVYARSRFGLMLRASRDDAVAARSAGVNIYLMRLIAFVVSAIFLGIGGALYASFLGTLSVDQFYLSATFLTLAMLIVGGVGSLTGAVTGVLFLTAVKETLRYFEAGVTVADVSLYLPKGFEQVCLGIIMIAILILRPSGLTKSQELPWPFAGGWRSARSRHLGKGAREWQ